MKKQLLSFLLGVSFAVPLFADDAADAVIQDRYLEQQREEQRVLDAQAERDRENMNIQDNAEEARREEARIQARRDEARRLENR